MKKQFFLFLFMTLTIFVSAQGNKMLLRHDTTLLNSDECEWIVKSLVKNDPALTPQLGKSIPLIILQAIQKGKLKAYDRTTNELIPAKEIFTWRMASDTVPQFDNEGNMTKYVVVKNEISSDMFSKIRVYQDWYMDIASGKIESQVKWIELIQEIKAFDGTIRGQMVFCRVYY